MSSSPFRNRRELAKALSSAENNNFPNDKWYEEIYHQSGHAKIIGITGAPGAGKSSLINLLIKEFRSKSMRVAVLAIDPSSPFSGGAILGDRTRMILSAEDTSVFIRSSASRGKLGGLSPRTPEMIHILDADKFDIIIIETVGVGQGELDIMKCAHVVGLVLSPHTGDGMQALKAGILEIADLYILNKSDLTGINDLEKDLLSSLMLSNEVKPILRTSVQNNEGISTLSNKLLEIHSTLENEGKLSKRIEKSIEFEFYYNLREELLNTIESQNTFSKELDKLKKKLKQRSISPQKGSKEIIKLLLKKLQS